MIPTRESGAKPPLGGSPAAAPGIVAQFVDILASRKASDRTFNPWRDVCRYDLAADGPAARRRRLEAHLTCEARILLVGEAPGYQGARYSGIPFTSERLLTERGIPRVGRTARFTNRTRSFTEPSATIVWGYLEHIGIAHTAVLWNAFPFHPYRGEPLTNRTPDRSEVSEQLEILGDLLALYPDAAIAAVGNVADALLTRIAGKRLRVKLRHPARGGARLFGTQLAAWTREIGIASPPAELLF
jgi:uracil-DNA glycosylase